MNEFDGLLLHINLTSRSHKCTFGMNVYVSRVALVAMMTGLVLGAKLGST